jgi:hypothetical protein
MKRNGMLANGLGLAVLVLCCQTAAADEKKETEKIAAPVVVERCCPNERCASAPNDQVQELIKILNETKSANTLVATTIALVPLGDKAKVAVPVILRNAERLKILESLGNLDSKKGEMASILVESIYAIQAGLSLENGVLQTRSQQPRGPAQMVPPTGYAPTPAPFYAPPAPTCPGPVGPTPPAQPRSSSY